MNVDDKSYVPGEKVRLGRDIINKLIVFNENYDLRELVSLLQDQLKDVCKYLHVKNLSCEIVPSDDDNAVAKGMEFLIYECEGPEFENTTYQCSMPGGETLCCSISYIDFSPEDIQLVNGRLLCEVVLGYLSRACVGTRLIDFLHKDPETGLPNVQAFLEFGEKLFNESKISEYCIVALNIANFKFVNQTVPFEVGTAVLIKYAHVLYSLLGPEEIVTRFGGDNFNVLIKKVHLVKFLENVRQIPIDIKDGNLRVHFELECYAGIFEFDTRIGIQVAVENASNARMVAKNTPHQQFVFYNEEMGERQHYMNHTRASFGRAMERHEFVAYYQPKVNVVTQKLIGLEALVRWNTGEEILHPSDFVSIFEDTNAIIELDRNMLLQACRDIKRWESMGLEVPRISVNLSRRNLFNKNIAAEIGAILDEYHVDHSNIEIEVTETVDTAEFTTLTQFIEDLRRQGIKVSIDDFGTGYSSLNLMKTLKADVLKVDRSFVDMENFTVQDEFLLKSIINLAKAYNMEVITEGVETEEQLKFLYKCGCENVQGFFFDKPMSKEAVTEIIARGGYNKEYTLD